MDMLTASTARVTGRNGGISRRNGAQTRASSVSNFVTVGALHSDNH
jgi:hypothetical protein